MNVLTYIYIFLSEAGFGKTLSTAMHVPSNRGLLSLVCLLIPCVRETDQEEEFVPISVGRHPHVTSYLLALWK